MSIGSSRLMISISRAMDSGRVGRKAEDVARPGHHLGPPPRLQHLAIFPDLVLALLGAHPATQVDVLEADEDGVAARPRRLLDEARILWQSVSTWRMSLILKPFSRAADEAVEDRLPVAVAGEIVVGDEKAGDALGGVGAHDRLDVVGGTVAGLAPLDVDDGAEAALERAAAAGVEAGVVPGDPGHDVARQHGIAAAAMSGMSLR